jgi:hypothetical protein
MNNFNTKIIISGCVRNCENHLKIVINTMIVIGNLFNDYNIILSYDISTDKSLDIIKTFQKTNNKIILLENKNKLSNIRTENISNARNLILNKIREININNDFKYFIMMDMDNVCNKKINIDVITKYINNDSNWDSISFNSLGYYDIWALSYDPYIYSCWHYYNDHKNNSNYIQNIIKPDIIKKLNNLNDNDNNELLDVYSAFGGFAIYKTDKFINCNYEWKLKESLKLIPKNMLDKNIKACNNIKPVENHKNISDCEHRYFHMSARIKNNAKIKISKMSVFN